VTRLSLATRKGPPCCHESGTLRLDDARARWLALAEPDQQVTAEEWLAAYRAATVEDDRHR
jgi:hypothetical protein